MGAIYSSVADTINKRIEILSSKVELSDSKVSEHSSSKYASLKSEIMELLENKCQEIKNDFKNDLKAITKTIYDDENEIRTLHQRSDGVVKSIEELKNEHKNLSKSFLLDFFLYVGQDDLF